MLQTCAYCIIAEGVDSVSMSPVCLDLDNSDFTHFLLTPLQLPRQAQLNESLFTCSNLCPAGTSQVTHSPKFQVETNSAVLAVLPAIRTALSRFLLQCPKYPSACRDFCVRPHSRAGRWSAAEAVSVPALRICLAGPNIPRGLHGKHHDAHHPAQPGGPASSLARGSMTIFVVCMCRPPAIDL